METSEFIVSKSEVQAPSTSQGLLVGWGVRPLLRTLALTFWVCANSVVGVRIELQHTQQVSE